MARRGAFKPLPGQQAQGFPGRVVDLSGRRSSVEAPDAQAPDGARRILLPGETAAPADLYQRHAQAQIHKVCIRPKETTIRMGPLGTVKLWKVQFVGEGRVWRRPDGSMDLQGIGNLVRVRAPWPTRIGWYLIGAPVFNTQMLWTWLRGRLVTEGAIITK